MKCLFLLPLLVLAVAFAQGETVRVGIAELPPFAFQSSDQWDGVAVQLWREVADDMGLTFRFVSMVLDEVEAQVARGDLELAITGVAQAEAEGRVDFSTPYYTTTLAVATPRTQSLWGIVNGLFTPRFARIVVFLSLALLVVGLLIWAIERRSNEENFGGERNVAEGIGAGFWWAAVTMTTIGYGDKAPATFWGRAVAFLWMLVAMGITASLTAALVSVVGTGSGGLKVPGDLRDKTVGSVADTHITAYLDQEEITFQTFDAALAGLRALQAGELEAFVANEATLRFLKSENSDLRFQVTATNAAPQRYAFVLPEDSDLNEVFNQTLLRRLNSRPYERLLERYLPKSVL